MSSCLVDLNIWLAIAHSQHSHHDAAMRWLNDLSDNAYFCRQTQLGLLRLLTNARVMGSAVRTQSEAWRVYDLLLDDPRIAFVHEPPDIELALRGLTHGKSSATNTWSDAYLGALARSLGLQIVSFDRVFRTMPGVEATVLETR